MYSETKSLYAALHAVVRFKLNRHYGNDLVSLNEAIPSDLLGKATLTARYVERDSRVNFVRRAAGSLWGERWGNVIDLIVDVPKTYDITARLKRRNYTVTDLVKRSEDFYLSLGFRPMTEEFWKNSKFVKDGDDDPVCHGSAANMFHGNDFRSVFLKLRKRSLTTKKIKRIYQQNAYVRGGNVGRSSSDQSRNGPRTIFHAIPTSTGHFPGRLSPH